MQNGSKVQLNLISYRQIDGVVFYKLEVQYQGQIFSWEQRYSVLKELCQQLPQTTVKFPPKNSLKHVLSQITRSEEFSVQRFSLMKEYFDSVSSQNDLRFNRAFLQIYRHLHQMNNTHKSQNNNLRAPVIKGKQLLSKKQDRNETYIIV